MRELVALAILSPAFLFGQHQSLAALALSELPALDASPAFAAWRSTHPGERLKPAAYDNEYESQGLWCIASVAEFTLLGGIKATRQAFFYVPADRSREPKIDNCQLRALWYQIDKPGDIPASISTELAASLGSPNEVPDFKRTDGDWGSGNWSPYQLWTQANHRVVLALDPNSPGPRLLVIARSPQAPHGLSFDWMGEAPQGQPALKACAYDDGHNNWQDGLIRAAEKVHADLTLARAYASKLLLTYPGIELDSGNRPTNPAALRRNAIAHFEAFLRENPGAPETTSASRELWRLRAGLPPTPNHFACTD